jgi:hypothetical protein
MMMVLTASMLFILCRTHKMAMVSTIVDPRGEFGDMPLNNTPTKTASAKTTNHRNTQQLHMPRILALYFPQYHADPLNNKHWGTNFTDWDSLRASPHFNREGYAIPRPTSELGYYDLSNVQPRQLQGQLAKKYGVDGFIYHHYWFYDPNNPGPTLATPLLEMLHDKQPDIPFFFNWCTVNWVNVWMGNAINQTDNKNCISPRGKRVKCPPLILQEQYFTPSLDEITLHYQWLSQFFHHANYIHINNQPVMLLYYYDERVIPIIQQLRILAIQDGYDGIYWIVGRSAAPNDIFTLHDTNLSTMMKRKTQTLDMISTAIHDGIFNQTLTYPYPLKWLIGSTYTIPHWCLRKHRQQNDEEEEHVTTTTTTAAAASENYNDAFPQEIIGILTSFDNTPRRQFADATIFNPDTPQNILNRFRTNLHTALYYTACCYQQRHPHHPHPVNNDDNDNKNDDKFVVINAWNEWGEGMALEPSDIYGYGFLDIIKEVKAELVLGGCVL